MASFEIADLFSVKDKVVLITGGGSGLGKAIARGFYVNGAKVYITGRRPEALQRTVNDFKAINAKLPGQIISVPGDVSTKDGCEAIYKALAEKEQHVDVLVNNAGVSRQIDYPYWDHNDADAVEKALWHGVDDEHFTFTNAVNLNAVYFMTVAFVPLLRKAEDASVIVISSLSGLTNQRALGSITYATSKAAALHLSKILAGRLAPLKIRVNCVLPGVFPSEMTSSGKGDDTDEPSSVNDLVHKAGLRSPSGRTGNPVDIAGPCLLLGSKASSYMNGGYIMVDGGRSMTSSINDGLRMPENTYVN
ncbi:NAD(P)-binding domain protein [Niveomyces insectorum RCEF 264]|uniref:NAD(P)-binding domain protein n=1 Tax=Niveomyces insectorum RCEF 264 TaxID=1081102 RepID=A0A162MRA5_9HYPO|nr:NAD(P)-binding domain protein [Niveomyces insectorum RCEF 264]